MVRTLSQEKKTQLLQAALKLFVANGVQHTATAAIAREAGTAAGTLFLYFPSKQDLVDELILQIGREQSGYVRSRLDRSLSTREIFLTIWDCSLGWFRANPEAYRFVLQVRDSGLVSDQAVQESNQYFGYYFSAIQQGLAEGAIQPYPIELIGAVLYQNIVAVMNLIQAQPDPLEQAELMRLGFEIFWDGIRRKASC